MTSLPMAASLWSFLLRPGLPCPIPSSSIGTPPWRSSRYLGRVRITCRSVPCASGWWTNLSAHRKNRPGQPAIRGRSSSGEPPCDRAPIPRARPRIACNLSFRERLLTQFASASGSFTDNVFIRRYGMTPLGKHESKKAQSAKNPKNPKNFCRDPAILNILCGRDLPTAKP